MGFDTGFWDSLFGERVTIEVPGQGGLRKVSVTKKWLEEMERSGAMTPVAAPTVEAHVLDPMRGYYVTTMVVGEELPIEDVAKFKDPATNAVYLVCKYEGTRRHTMVVKKALWDTAKGQFSSISKEEEAAAAFVNAIMTYVKDKWSELENTLAPALTPGDRQLLADQWVRFEFALAALAEESQAISNLLPSDLATRILEHLEASLDMEGLDGTAVEGFEAYDEAWHRALTRNEPPFGEVASVLYDRVGFTGSFQTEEGRFKDPVLLMAISSTLLMPGRGWWKANLGRFGLSLKAPQ